MGEPVKYKYSRSATKNATTKKRATRKTPSRKSVMERPVKLPVFTPLPTSEDATNLERMLAQIPEGKVIAISYARQIAVTDERFRKFIHAYDADKRIDIGTLCDTCTIPHADFLSTILKEAFPVMDEAMKFSHLISTSIVAARLPNVVKRGMIEGARSEGVTDRHFILQKEGFHTAPPKSSININQINAGGGGLPSFEDQTRELTAILKDSPLELTEGETDYIEAEFESELEEITP